MKPRCDEVTFLALTCWREARGAAADECIAGVAYSILNRVARPSWWGGDILSVVFKRWQYSSLTDPRDPQLTTWPRSGEFSWERCLRITEGVLAGEISNPVPGADSYHDISIPPPKWAAPETFVGQLGRIRFYNLDRDYEET